jgi:hypothetical protein
MDAESTARARAAEKNTARVRYHLAGDMKGVGELRRLTAPAVVLRPDGSADVYGQVAIVDQVKSS